MRPRLPINALLATLLAIVLVVFATVLRDSQSTDTFQPSSSDALLVARIAIEIDATTGEYKILDELTQGWFDFENIVGTAFANEETIINAQLQLIGLNTSPLSEGIFEITPTFINLGPDSLTNLFFRVTALRYADSKPPPPELDNRNADTPASVGAELDAALPGGLLSEGDTFSTTFDIFLPRLARFVFFVNVLTIPEPPSDEGPLEVEILTPDSLSFFGSSPITISGRVNGSVDTTVAINGVPATITGNPGFTAEIELEEGNNIITAVAEDPASGEVSTDSIQVTLDTIAPSINIDFPPDGFVTNSSTVTVAGLINDIVVGTVNGDQAQVIVNGLPAEVSNRSFLLPDLTLALGPNLITAIGTDKAGNTVSTSISVVFNEMEGEPQISLISGNNQQGPIGTLLSEPLVVDLIDENGNKVPDEIVIFKVMKANGALSNSPENKRSLDVLTNAEGQAQVNWTPGTRVGAGNNVVEAMAVGFKGMAIFTATVTFGDPDKINVDSGNNQKGEVGEPLPLSLVAVVTDAGHNRLPGIPVTFEVAKGGGNLGGAQSITIQTDSDGRALAEWTLGPNSGLDNNMVDATFPGNLGLPATFVASGLEVGDSSETKVSGVVLDNTDLPVEGVTVTIEGTALTTQTDAQGIFVLEPAPVGHILLHVDGSTAQRPGTWPALEFELTAISGQNNTIGMPVYLLPLDIPNGLFVDESIGGILTLPNVPGFSLTVEAGSATFPDGSKSGTISVTLVDNDRIPMVPNFGQQPRLVVTIQPVGVLFDPPAPITLPNVDGLAPGEVTEIYSLDHNLGQFIAIGTGTVSDDGTVIESDSGIGIIKGGWHWGGNPAQTGGAQNAFVNITTPGPVILSNGNTTAISANGGPSPGSYSWSSRDSSVVKIVGPSSGANVSSITIEAVEFGTATINVTYTSQSGASDSDSIQVIVGPSLEITSISPSGMFKLGDDLTVNYKIEPPGTSFDTVDMEISNSGGTMVFKRSGLPTGAGNHSTTWQDGKWNQAPHAGAFANPNNGPYEIKLIGKKGGDTDENTESVTTKLILEAKIKDTKGATASESAGLDDVLNGLKVVMKTGGAETVITTGITKMGANRDEKEIKVEDAALNGLADGNYEVFFRDLRDEIGNFADDDNNPDNGVETKIGEIDLR